MKKIYLKRMLLLAVMLMTLTCVFALTAFAETADAPTFTYNSVTKKISGLTPTTDSMYYILQLSMNKEGTVMQAVDGTKENLATNDEGKADLSNYGSGLWGVGINETDTSAASEYRMVYIQGTLSEKQSLGDIDENGKPAKKSGAVWTGNDYWTDWETGIWKGSDVLHNVKIDSYYRISNDCSVPSLKASTLNDGSVYDKLYRGSEQEKAAAQNTIKEQVNAFSYKYAYMGEEIIPAKDFISFTYRVGRRQGSIKLAAAENSQNTNTKLVVYVANADNTITKYEKLVNEPTMDLRKSNRFSDSTNKKIVFNAEDLLNDENSSLEDSDGYIVGIEIFPVQITAPAEIEIEEPNSSNKFTKFAFNVEVIYGEYAFDTPVADVPEFDFNEATKVISGLEATTDSMYYILQLSINKEGTVMQAVDGTKKNLVTNAEGKADLSNYDSGLWGVGINGNENVADSAYKMIYIQGTLSEKQNLGDIDENGKPAKKSGAVWTGNDYWTDWETGIWKGSDYIDTSGGAPILGEKYRVASSGASVPSLVADSDTYKALLAGDEEAQKTIAMQINNFSYKYAYMDEEIIPAKDFVKFTYRVGKRQGSAELGASESSANTNTKLVVYVAESDNTITKYEQTINEPTMLIKGTKFSNQSESTNKKIVFNAEDLLNDENSSLEDSDGYIVGIEIFPVQITDHKEITTKSTGTRFCFNVEVIYGEYAFNTPVADVPEFDFNEATKVISGLEATTADMYYILQLSMNEEGTEMYGVDSTKKNLVTNAEGKVNLSDFTPGLWGVGINGNEYVADSSYKMVYISNPSNDKQILGDLDAEGKPAKAKDTAWEKGLWKGTNYIFKATLGSEYQISNDGQHVSTPSLVGSTVGDGSLQDKLYGGDEQEKAAAQNAIAEEVNALSYKYAYMDDEIITTKDFISFTYRVGKRQGHIVLAKEGSDANTNTMLVVYVANPDNTITKYEKLVNEPTMDLVNNNSFNDKIVVRAEDLSNGEQSLKNADGYVVGIEIFPVQITAPAEIYAEPKENVTFNYYAFNVQVIYSDYVIRETPDLPRLNVENAFSVDKVDGKDYAYATITGLIPSYRYEMLVDEASDTWVELPYYSNGEYNNGGEGTENMTLHKSEYSIKVPVDINDDRTETYVIRVKDSELTTASQSVELKVYYLEGDGYEFASLENEEQIINFASDFIEVQADYTIDLIKKPWTQNIALNNLKLASPNALVTFEGDGFKFVVRAEDININRTVHYYSFNVALNGSSRKDFYYEDMKAIAGDKFVAEYMLDSLYELPFTKADLYIYVGEEHSGKTLELRSYYQEIGRLRKWAEADVYDGWIIFNLYDQPYVIYDNN